MKTSERDMSRRLRLEGRSIKEIARIVGVSQASVSVWVRAIELTLDQRAVLTRRTRAGQERGRAIRSARARAQRQAWQDKGRERARHGDVLHVAGCMLFWAEGGKDRNKVEFTNSDPEMVRFFLSFLRRCYGVEDSRVRITCNLFADHVERQQAIEDFWLRTLDLPGSSLTKSIVNVYSKRSKRLRVNRLPHGTCRLVVHSTEIAQSLFGAIQEYGAFTNETWVDCLHGSARPARS